MGNRVHSGPVPSRQGGLLSTIVRWRGATSHSTRTWSRACGGTRSSHQRRARAMSSSGSSAIGSVFLAPADVGGIAHPVAGGGALPGDGDVYVDAEHAGEDGGGELGGELEQGGGAGWAGADADLVEAFVELAGADRLAGASAWQQPWGGALVSGSGVALAGGDQVKDETGERFGKYDGFPAEPQVYFTAAGLDVTEGKAADGGGLLGVEQDEQPSDPVLRPEGTVIQQLPGLCPSPFGVDDTGGACPPGGREAQAGQLLVASPADEVPGRAALADARRGRPLVEIALRAGGQREPACGQPGQECHGGGDVPAGDAGLVVGGVGAADPVTQPAEYVPGRVAVQDLLLLPVGPAGDGLRDPAFELDEVLVAGGQRSGGDQDAAQMHQWLARGEFVERDLRGGAGEPGQDSGWPASGGQRLVQDLQLGADVAGAVGEQLVKPLTEMAAAACSGDQAPGAAAGRAGLEEARVRDGAVSAQRRVTSAGAGRGELPAP